MMYILKKICCYSRRVIPPLLILILMGAAHTPASGQDLLGLLTPEDGAYIYTDHQTRIGQGFNVYRTVDGTEVKLTETPVYPAASGGEFQRRIGDLYDEFEERLEVSSPHEAFLTLRGDSNMRMILSFSYPEIAMALGHLFIDEDPVSGREVIYRFEWVDRNGNPIDVEAREQMILQQHESPVAENIDAKREGDQVKIEWSYPEADPELDEYVIRFDLYVRPGSDEHYQKVTERPILRQSAVTEFSHRFDLNPSYETAEIVVEAVDYTGKVRQTNTPVEVEIRDARQPSSVLEVYSNRTSENYVDITWPVSAETYVVGYHIDRVNQDTEETVRITDQLIDLSSPSFRDTTAEEGYTYYYFAKAVSATGIESEEGNPAIVLIPSMVPPPAPRDLSAELNEDGDVELRWDGNNQDENFNTFVVLRRLFEDGQRRAFAQVNSERVVEEFMKDGGIAEVGFTEGLFYEYGVAAANRHGLRSDTVYAVLQIPNVTPPEPPVSFETDIDRGVRLNLRWGASPSTDVTSYNLYKMTEDNDTTVTTLPRDRRFLADDDVQPGKEYQYFVTAVDSSGNESEPSKIAELLMRDQSPPASVRNLQAVNTDDGIHLRWQPSTSDDVLGYLVQRSALSNGIYDTLTSEPVDDVDWIDEQGEPGIWYRIVAVDESGNESRPSSPRQAVTSE